MAITRSQRNKTLLFDAAGDLVSGPLLIKAIVIGTAGTGGTFILKDGGGVICMQPGLGANDSVVVPFGGNGNDPWDVDGLEMDAAPASGTMTVILA